MARVSDLPRTRSVAALLFLWSGWRPVYDPQHVRAAARMLREYVRMPLTVALLTDRPSVSGEDCCCDLVMPLPESPPVAVRGPADCMRRLRLLSREFQSEVGADWLMSIDLDTLIFEDVTGTLSWAMDQDEGFVIQRGSGASGRPPYSGGFWMVESGRHCEVWDELGPHTARAIEESGWVGSDQVVLSLRIPDATTLGPEDGFWFRRLMDEVERPALLHYSHGLKPWSPREVPELREHWQRFAA